MRKIYLTATAALLLSAGGAALIAQSSPAPMAQPGQHDATRITGGSYTVDPGHTQILFAYDHMGFTRNMGVIAAPESGALTIDPKTPGKAQVTVSFPVANIRTGIAALDEHLMKAEMFDAAQFPTATFTSTSVKVDPDDMEAEITGNLTIKGVTKEVTLDAEFIGAGTNPMSKKETVGFSADGIIRRSDFGLGYAVPVVGDTVELKIVAAFEK
ncbi:MAG: polyisoprenoid-binding protein [Sphingomonadales bacterium]|nr:MAG: polyisoprenoid-binding protein [Sphingomonadales bacterium]TNF02118.1 MAG: polyisoprenoid-binding protein [Sphingomonadales bacterium]